MVPTNPPVSMADVTGAEIRQMIEENLERTFAADPYDQMGGYIKRMRGVGLAFKAENPPGRRIERLFLEGRPAVDDARSDEHTSEIQSLMRNSYTVFCLKPTPTTHNRH